MEPARHAMGDTLRLAKRIGLVQMRPRGELSSTGYALANPGEESLVLQPTAAADPFTVRLAAGTYTVEWFSVQGRQAVPGAATTVDRPMGVGFSAPPEASGPTVLYLKAAST